MSGLCAPGVVEVAPTWVFQETRASQSEGMGDLSVAISATGSRAGSVLSLRNLSSEGEPVIGPDVAIAIVTPVWLEIPPTEMTKGMAIPSGAPSGTRALICIAPLI